MIAINDQGKLVSISVIGEFTVADYKEFEEHVLYHLKAGGVSLLLDLRDDPMMRLDEFRFVAQPVGRDVTERYAVA